MDNKIYLNSAAGCKVYPEVIKTMDDVLINHWGNASSETSDGVDAKNIINDVSKQIVKDINADNISEIIFTSGACESNSLAIKGFMCYNNCEVLITSNLEHTSIDEIKKNKLMCKKICILDIANDTNGNIILSDLENKCSRLVKPFVSVSFANSEIGTVQDIKKISDIVHRYDGVLHVDATQAYPWIKIDVKSLGIDMMSVSAQKFHGPRGMGFLYVKPGIYLEPQISGSQQEGMRGGTYPTHLIAGMGKALEIIRNDYDISIANVSYNTAHIYEELCKVDGIYLNGPKLGAHRLPNVLSITINNVDSEKLITMCDLMGVIISRSSACKSYNPEPSKTLINIGMSRENALNTIRISIDDTTKIDDIDKAIRIIVHLIERIRKENAE